MNDFRFSQRSRDHLEDVDGRLAAVAGIALRLSPLDFAVIDGIRTEAQQEALVEAGASKTMDSAHLVGEAIDIMVYVNGKGRWEEHLYRKVHPAFEQAAEIVGIPLVWGGDWGWDFGHYEIVT